MVLITDLNDRGMDRDVAVVVWGEFGRTPRANQYGGRDHWTPAGFAWFAGGGFRTGQAIGRTDAQEFVSESSLQPQGDGLIQK